MGDLTARAQDVILDLVDGRLGSIIVPRDDNRLDLINSKDAGEYCEGSDDGREELHDDGGAGW